MSLHYNILLNLRKNFLHQRVRNTLYFLFICLSAPNAFSMETRDDWINAGQPVRYLLIKPGQGPKKLCVVDKKDDESRAVVEGTNTADAQEELTANASKSTEFVKDTDTWHLGVQEEFWRVSSLPQPSGQTLGNAIPTNAARIRVIARYETGETTCLELPHVFLSGGIFDTKKNPLLRFLVDSFGPGYARFMDDVVQSKNTGKEKAKEYRENMIELFRLKSIAKERSDEEHTGNSFDIISNLRTLKYFKQPADIMFADSNFIYEFYDSEQVAREFMNGSVKVLPETYQPEDDESRLKALKGVDDHFKALFPLFDMATNTALRSELRTQLKLYVNEGVDFGRLFPKINIDVSQNNNNEDSKKATADACIEKLRKLRELQIQIASHGDMCQSCQGTYWYELEESHNLERNLFRAITQKALQTLQKYEDEPQQSASQKPPPNKKPRSSGSPTPPSAPANTVSAFNLIANLLKKLENANKSEDPRTQFFPDCDVSVLVSCTRKKAKESRPHVPLSALLAEKTRSPAPEIWWEPEKRGGSQNY